MNAPNCHGETTPAKEMRFRQDGENNNRAVLTWSIVRQIRADYVEEPNASTIAARYRISRPHVFNIISGRRWKYPNKYTPQNCKDITSQ